MENNLSEVSKHAMRKGAAWMKFYAITMLIFSVVGLIFSFYIIGIAIEQARIAGLLLMIMCSFFIWAHAMLIQYSIHLSGSTRGNQSILEKAFAKQKIYYIVIGVFSILSMLYNLYNYSALL